MYHQIEEVTDSEKREKAGLKDNKETLIMIAQEEALSTRVIEGRIYHPRKDLRCRLCQESPETIRHKSKLEDASRESAHGTS